LPLHRYETVEQYLSAQPQPLCDIGLAVAAIATAELPEATASLWHGHPTWRIAKAPICQVRAYTRHVTFALWRGSQVEDPTGRLAPSGAQQMAAVKLRSVGEVDAGLFAGWLEQARTAERAASG
jgi:hypothetical protein